MCVMLFPSLFEKFSHLHFSTLQRISLNLEWASQTSPALMSYLEMTLKNIRVFHCHSTVFCLKNIRWISLLTSLGLLKMPPSLHLTSYKYSDHPWWLLLLPLPDPSSTKFHGFHHYCICCVCTLPSLLLAFKRHWLTDVKLSHFFF